MLGAIARVEYHKAKAELLQLALDSVEMYDKLFKEALPDSPMRESYRASADGWRQLLDELVTIF